MQMITDTPEYKEWHKLVELHNSYGKHKGDEQLSYGVHKCKGCGLPYDKDTGKTIENIAAEIFPRYGDCSREIYNNISDMIMAKAIDINGEQGFAETAVNYKMMQLRDRLDLTAFRAAMLADGDSQPDTLYLYATKIEQQPSQDIYDKLVGILASKAGWDNRSGQAAKAIMAWHQHFNTKPTKQIFKTAITKFSDRTNRTIWSRIAGVCLAVSYRWKFELGAAYSYCLIRDKDTKKYNDIGYMTKLYGVSPTATLMYYRDTGRLITEFNGIDAVIKSKLVDKAATPTPEDKTAMGSELYNLFYGDRVERLCQAHLMTPTCWHIMQCATLEEYLDHEHNFHANELDRFHYNADETRGFGVECPVPVEA